MFSQATVAPAYGGYAQLNPYPTIAPGAAGKASATGGAAGGKTLMIIVGVIGAGILVGMALGLGLGIGAAGILSDQPFINVTNATVAMNSTR